MFPDWEMFAVEAQTCEPQIIFFDTRMSAQNKVLT